MLAKIIIEKAFQEIVLICDTLECDNLTEKFKGNISGENPFQVVSFFHIVRENR